MGIARKIRTWLKLPHHFSRRDFEEREKFRPDYQRVARAVAHRVDFEDLLDVGCANGFLLEEMLALGKRVQGLEVSPDVLAVLAPTLAGKVAIGDFREATGRFDLVSCVEVAEHIPPERSLELVETLTSCARRWIYFTAAPPGQNGKGHINCRPHTEWLAWFESRGWGLDAGRTEALRAELAALTHARWLQGNSMVLSRRDQEGPEGTPAP